MRSKAALIFVTVLLVVTLVPGAYAYAAPPVNLGVLAKPAQKLTSKASRPAVAPKTWETSKTTMSIERPSKPSVSNDDIIQNPALKSSSNSNRSTTQANQLASTAEITRQAQQAAVRRGVTKGNEYWGESVVPSLNRLVDKWSTTLRLSNRVDDNQEDRISVRPLTEDTETVDEWSRTQRLSSQGSNENRYLIENLTLDTLCALLEYQLTEDRDLPIRKDVESYLEDGIRNINYYFPLPSGKKRFAENTNKSELAQDLLDVAEEVDSEHSDLETNLETQASYLTLYSHVCGAPL